MAVIELSIATILLALVTLQTLTESGPHPGMMVKYLHAAWYEQRLAIYTVYLTTFR